MKTLIRGFLINGIALYLIGTWLSGVSFSKGYETIIVAAIVLGLANLFLRPLLNILLLPINLLTLGLFRWIVNVGILLLVTNIVPDFRITAFIFPGISLFGFDLPTLYLGTITSFIFVSLLLSLISGFLFWVVK